MRAPTLQLIFRPSTFDLAAAQSKAGFCFPHVLLDRTGPAVMCMEWQAVSQQIQTVHRHGEQLSHHHSLAICAERRSFQRMCCHTLLWLHLGDNITLRYVLTVSFFRPYQQDFQPQGQSKEVDPPQDDVPAWQVIPVILHCWACPRHLCQVVGRAACHTSSQAANESARLARCASHHGVNPCRVLASFLPAASIETSHCAPLPVGNPVDTSQGQLSFH